MKIILVGFMGTGKSFYGKKIANKLQLDHIDSDSYIQTQEGSSIDKIFNSKGEDYFRLLETKFLDTLTEKNHFVLSTGGGLPCFNNNMEKLKKMGICVWLDVSVECILRNVTQEENIRPLLKNKSIPEIIDYIKVTLDDRKPLYSMAHIQLSLNKMVDVNYVMEKIKNYAEQQ